MNNILSKIAGKQKKIALGFMSGTSLDGMDAVLAEMEGSGLSTKLNVRGFLTLPYNDEIRSVLMKAVMGEEGGSSLICALNFLIGELSLRAGLELCKKTGIPPESVDFAGSHGQTVYHQPEPVPMGGCMVRGTLQIGEASVIAEGLGCPVVSDFRVRDMAAGGQGAPLVPYTEYLLYRREDISRALLNIGGIANITLLPSGCGAQDITAFDTGPGNMVIDAVSFALTGKPVDEGGACAASGKINSALLKKMLEYDGDYLDRKPPKSTGRERYNADYVKKVLSWRAEDGISINDTLSTVTYYTAETVARGIKTFCLPCPKELFISGGGLHNKTLVSFIKELLPGCDVKPGDELGMPADAKEAAAFAVLANEAIHGLCNNAPAATGARHPVVMGKITF